MPDGTTMTYDRFSEEWGQRAPIKWVQMPRVEGPT